MLMRTTDLLKDWKLYYLYFYCFNEKNVLEIKFLEVQNINPNQPGLF